MILTVTPNPSLDRTYEVPSLDRGEVLRATADRMDPGGKGVNVSRAVAAAGHRTAAVMPLGGPAGAVVAQLLGDENIEVAGVPVRGHTRSNISVAEPGGTLTKINAPGPELSPDEAEALLETVRLRSAGVSWIACCGSLPRGLPPEWYAELVARAHRAGARIALDTSGPALAAALRERPDVVKPNAEELAEAVGRPLATVGDAVKAAEELRDRGARAVLASLGAAGQLLVESADAGGAGAPRTGASAADPSGAGASGADAGGAGASGAGVPDEERPRKPGSVVYFGYAPVAGVRSDVGAGDASLAGFLAAGGTGPAALAAAVAHGAAAVRLPGSVMPSPADLDLSAVTTTTDIPLDRPLGTPAGAHRTSPTPAAPTSPSSTSPSRLSPGGTRAMEPRDE